MDTSLKIYHPNGKGTGAMVSVELHPAHDEVEGSVFLSFAEQATVGSIIEGKHTFPTFDHDNKVTVRLSATEVAQVLEVIRGYHEKLADGQGLFHRTATANTVLTFEHRLEPVPGYLISVSRKTNSGELRRIGLLVSMHEALVLSEALAGSMVYLAFGVPSIG